MCGVRRFFYVGKWCSKRGWNEDDMTALTILANKTPHAGRRTPDVQAKLVTPHSARRTPHPRAKRASYG